MRERKKTAVAAAGFLTSECYLHRSLVLLPPVQARRSIKELDRSLVVDLLQLAEVFDQCARHAFHAHTSYELMQNIFSLSRIIDQGSFHKNLC